ncbi:hypothetical protein SAMN04487950_0526 [Halogranum rubrum]|uniref:Uncharacterized protein n=1 Tax=Halogranum rubrum TaxID=553466 RepID=A0A1I4BGW7_9EURY|nr:hypothetical protein SAMN04487950_0526 [Halogranum rubrum]
MTALEECAICGAKGLPERIAVHECQDFLERRQRRVMSRFIREGGASAGRASESQEELK